MAQRHPIEYAKILHRLMQDIDKKDHEEAIAVYVAFLAKQQALSKIQYIIESYERMARDAEGIVSLDITAARDVSGAVVKRIEQTFGDTVESTVTYDNALIGGVVVKTGNTIVDGSIRTQLDELKKALM